MWKYMVDMTCNKLFWYFKFVILCDSRIYQLLSSRMISSYQISNPIFFFFFYQNLLLYSNTMWSKMPPQRHAHSNHVILCHSLGHTSTTVLKTQNLLDYFNTRVIWVDVYILIKSAKNFIHMVCVSVRVIISRRFPETQSLTPEWVMCLWMTRHTLSLHLHISLSYQIDQQHFSGPAWLIFHKLLHALLMFFPPAAKLFQY